MVFFISGVCLLEHAALVRGDAHTAHMTRLHVSSHDHQKVPCLKGREPACAIAVMYSLQPTLVRIIAHVI